MCVCVYNDTNKIKTVVRKQNIGARKINKKRVFYYYYWATKNGNLARIGYNCCDSQPHLVSGTEKCVNNDVTCARQKI